MTKDSAIPLSGDVLEEEVELTVNELCRVCGLPAEQVFELVAEGIIDPRGADPAGWRFGGISVRRARCALRLQRDLGVNCAGAALALELLDEIAALRARLARPR